MPGVKEPRRCDDGAMVTTKASVLILVYAVNRYVRASGAPGEANAALSGLSASRPGCGATPTLRSADLLLPHRKQWG
jgi:hypothetical protein